MKSQSLFFNLFVCERPSVGGWEKRMPFGVKYWVICLRNASVRVI